MSEFASVEKIKSYYIYCTSNKKWCGPVFKKKESKASIASMAVPPGMKCSFSHSWYQTGKGLQEETALSFMFSLKRGMPRSSFKLYRLTAKMEKMDMAT